MSSFEDWQSAVGARDAIKALVEETVREMQPPYRYAQVVTIDRYTGIATVQFPEGGDPMPVQMGSLQPAYIGQIVRVDGVSGDRFIDDVIGQVIVAPGEAHYGGVGVRVTNWVPPTLNNWNTVQFDGVYNPPGAPGSNKWNFSTHKYICPFDAIYTGSGILRAFRTSGVAIPNLDWATSLFKNGSPELRLDEFLGTYPGNVPIHLRLDFRMAFFAGDELSFGFFNGTAGATIEQIAASGEWYSWFRIDVHSLIVE